MRRRKLVVGVVLAAAGAVAFFEARQPHRAQVDLAADEVGDAPAYPFPEPERDGLEERLRRQQVVINFDQTPLAEALDVLHLLANVTIEVDARLADRVSDTKVSLRVRGIAVTGALLLCLASLDVPAVPVYTQQKVRIMPVDAVPPRPLWQRVSAAALFKSRAGGEADWVRDYKRKLASMKITANFAETPLSEVVQFLQDLTGLNLTVGLEVDQEALKVQGQFRDKTAVEVLDAICAQAGIAWRFKNETIFLAPPRPRSALLARPVSLELRGARVPDLVAALASESVPVLASPEAWRGRGTFSVVVDHRPLEEAIAEINSASGLDVAFVEEPEELVAIQGEVPSVSKALAARIPAGFSGVKAQVAERRADLEQAVVERNAIRHSAAHVALVAAEARVHGHVKAILELSSWAEAVDESPERVKRAEAELAAPPSKKGPAGTGSAKLEQRRAQGLVAVRARLLAGARLRLNADTGELEAVDAPR